jgi:hypothetical protein
MKPHPKISPLTRDDLVAFLTAAPIARLSSMNPDGTIHSALVFFKYDHGDILIGVYLPGPRYLPGHRSPQTFKCASDSLLRRVNWGVLPFAVLLQGQ